MRFQWEYLAAGAAGIIVLMLVWFAAPIFHVAGANALVLRAGILLLGVICIVGLLLWARSQRPELPAAAAVAPEVPTARPAFLHAGRGSEDVDILIREAADKVAAARLAAGAKLSSLPVVFLLGESGLARPAPWTSADWMLSFSPVRSFRKAASFRRESQISGSRGKQFSLKPAARSWMTRAPGSAW